MCTYIYIYNVIAWGRRGGPRNLLADRDGRVCLSMYLCIYIYIERERER